jgi:hypothetical protein
MAVPKGFCQMRLWPPGLTAAPIMTQLQFPGATTSQGAAVIQMLTQRRFVFLASLLVPALAFPGFGASAQAQVAASVQAGGRVVPATSSSGPGAGYQCAPLASLATAKAGRTGTVAVHVGGFVETYSGTEAHLSHLATGFFAYPGTIKVNERTRNWLLPAPADPKDTYFELGGLCAVQFSPGAPDVLAEGYSGGAHCCYAPTLYRYSAGAYRVVEDLTKPGVGKGLHWNPNEGFQPERIGTVVVLESSDGAFPYTFGCYACTPAPMRLFTVSGGRLMDVTTRYPARVAAEAGGAWKAAVQSMGNASDAGLVEGPLAQWAADECELNQGAQMWQKLEQLQTQGKLAAAERQSFDNKQTFPVQLKNFLLKEGYCQGQL